MLPTEDLFVYLYMLIDDAIKAGAIAIPARPGPAPACSDGASANCNEIATSLSFRRKNIFTYAARILLRATGYF